MLKLLDKIKKDFIVLDGDIKCGLEPCSEKDGFIELLNITSPEKIELVHRNYVAAGAELVHTNTLMANSKALEGTGYTVNEVINAGILCAKKSGASYTALSIGPVGLGTDSELSFDDAVSLYREMMEAGSRCDIYSLMGFENLNDVKAAVIAAKECSDKPVMVTLSFLEGGRNLFGSNVECAAAVLNHMGIAAIGIYDSGSLKKASSLIRELFTLCNLPLVFRPSGAGVTPDEFGDMIKKLLPLGVRMAGGGSAAGPDYIMRCAVNVGEFRKELAKAGEQKLMAKREETDGVICSGKKCVYLDSVRIIGDRLNQEENEEFRRALLENDLEYVKEMAVKQVEAGADILDINVATGGINESSTIVEIIKTVQSVVDAPLQINSRSIHTLEAALKVYTGKPILYSACGDMSSFNRILPLAAKYGAAIVGVTIDNNRIPETSVARYSIAERIYRQALKHNIPKENVIIDCLAMIAKTQQKYITDTFGAMQRVRTELSLNTTLNVSNAAYELPNASVMTSSYLSMSLCYGLTLPVINPLDEGVLGAVRSFRVICGQDRKAAEYINVYSR